MFGWKKSCDISVTIARNDTVVADQLAKVLTEMANLKDDIAALADKVAANTAVDQSVATLIDGLSAQVKDITAQLNAAGVDPTLVAQVEALTNTLDQNTQMLAAKVVVNTPAAVQPASDPAPVVSAPDASAPDAPVVAAPSTSATDPGTQPGAQLS